MRRRVELEGLTICDFEYRALERPRELIVLLHGYQQSGSTMMSRLSAVCPKDAAVVAPCGPFPLPERRDDGTYRLGFGWYFYDPSSDEYFIDMRVALRFLRALVEHLGLSALPKRWVGFSQGGYLAPFAALELGGATQVIGMAASYLPEEIDLALAARGQSWPPDVRVDSVHGAADDVVEPEGAERAHRGMLARGARGEWLCVQGEGHRLSPGMIAAVGGMLARA